MDGSGGWAWFWLVAVVILAIAELLTPFLFFMISFAIGAAFAAGAAFFDANVIVQWALFLAGSGLSLAVLVPIGHRMAQGDSDSTPEGSSRWAGRIGVVLEPIPAGPHATGLIRLEREKWRAETPGAREIPAGTTVMVLRVQGTRVIVVPADSESAPFPAPDQSDR